LEQIGSVLTIGQLISRFLLVASCATGSGHSGWCFSLKALTQPKILWLLSFAYQDITGNGCGAVLHPINRTDVALRSLIEFFSFLTRRPSEQIRHSPSIQS